MAGLIRAFKQLALTRVLRRLQPQTDGPRGWSGSPPLRAAAHWAESSRAGNGAGLHSCCFCVSRAGRIDPIA